MKRKIYLVRFVFCLVTAIVFGLFFHFISKNSDDDVSFAFITSLSALGTFAIIILPLLHQENILLILCKRELKKQFPELDTSIITLKNFLHIKKPLTKVQYLTLDSSKESSFFEFETSVSDSSGAYIDESLTFYSFDEKDGYLVLISTPYFIRGKIESVEQPRVEKVFEFKNGRTYILSFSQRIKKN